MAHVRTQIRSEFADVLSNALPQSLYKIYASRKSAINHDPSTAIVDMRFLNDQTRQAEVMNETMGGTDDYPRNEPRIHVASFYIRVQRSALEELLDDSLDEDEVAIVTAIAEHNWRGILEEQPELVQVVFSDSDTAGRIIGSLALRYDLEYRINKHDPEQIIS